MTLNSTHHGCPVCTAVLERLGQDWVPGGSNSLKRQQEELSLCSVLLGPPRRGAERLLPPLRSQTTVPMHRMETPGEVSEPCWGDGEVTEQPSL